LPLRAALFLGLVLLEAFGDLGNPYIGIVVFVTVPVIVVGGLLLIPVGAWWSNRRRRRHPEFPVDWPDIDLRRAHQRHVLTIALVLTVVNILIMSMAACTTWTPPSSAASSAMRRWIRSPQRRCVQRARRTSSATGPRNFTVTRFA
jgi:hypothetical protein